MVKTLHVILAFAKIMTSPLELYPKEITRQVAKMYIPHSVVQGVLTSMSPVVLGKTQVAFFIPFFIKYFLKYI